MRPRGALNNCNTHHKVWGEIEFRFPGIMAVVIILPLDKELTQILAPDVAFTRCENPLNLVIGLPINLQGGW